MANRTVAISRGVVTGPDGLVEKNTKSHAARRIALDERASVVLADHAAHMQANAAACRITLADSAFVFSNTVDDSEPWYPDSVSRSFQRLCKQEGLPAFAYTICATSSRRGYSAQVLMFAPWRAGSAVNCRVRLPAERCVTGGWGRLTVRRPT